MDGEEGVPSKGSSYGIKEDLELNSTGVDLNDLLDLKCVYASRPIKVLSKIKGSFIT